MVLVTPVCKNQKCHVMRKVFPCECNRPWPKRRRWNHWNTLVQFIPCTLYLCPSSNIGYLFLNYTLILRTHWKQTGHPRPWHWREVPAHSAELWPGHWNGLTYLHEAETGPTHWQGHAPCGGPYHVVSAAVQQDPGSHGSISTSNIEFLLLYNEI